MDTPVCYFCKEIGNSLKRCKSAPVLCSTCKSTTHLPETCLRSLTKSKKKKSSAQLDPPILQAGSSQSSKHSKLAPAMPIYEPKSSGVLKLMEPVIHADSGAAPLKTSGGDLSSKNHLHPNIRPPLTRAQRIRRLLLNQILSVQVSIVAKSLQMVTYEVVMPGSQKPIIVSFVYASNMEALRRCLWDEIVAMASHQSVLGKAWLVLGNFNQALQPSDHYLPQSLNFDLSISLFQHSLVQASLSDLTYRGNSFTWWNKRVSDPIAKKIDKILVNDEWQNQFSLSYGLFGEPSFSDHASTAIIISSSATRKKRPFKFFNLLLQNEAFVPYPSNMLKTLKKPIRDFSRENYSNIEKRVEEAHNYLLATQRQVLANPFPYWAEQESAVHNKWQELGNKIADQAAMLEHCVDYFKGLLGMKLSHLCSGRMIYLLSLTSLVPRKTPTPLSLEFSLSEIKEAFFSLPRNKCSGPNGFSAEFFTGCWDVIGAEVSAAVSEFFSTGQMLKKWNATVLVLIPKILNASKTSDFRPIALLNTVYKVVSKILAGRLKKILISVIENDQSAFMLASFSISVNGITGGFFKSSKGLRQRDSLSPYLFVLAMEVFSRLLESRFLSDYIVFHPKTDELYISHLMFADDVMIFFDGSSNSLHGITETLEDFVGWSELKMN
ncbi:uncharacterized protein LOC112082963 [Eutrema salsugineum]|uniref:uncharacterized protein LOC112082963 n=1 Tax=Eutrema salsugineum TaxID=72664 RepID=UPI000CECEBD8|nr:uncharacterized protein LOC112082963 [Eutrema salsugineum]